MIGRIYRASAAAGQRTSIPALVIVTDVAEAAQIATVTLLSPDVEFGSNTDIFIPGDAIDTPYNLIAHSDVFGYVWLTQLDRPMSYVDQSVLDDLVALPAGEAVTNPLGGPPVFDRNDPRWAFKLSELTRLQLVTAECTGQLFP